MEATLAQRRLAMNRSASIDRGGYRSRASLRFAQAVAAN
jgi:hypothetical protein